jgi:LuxR family transcriptional regulator, maltose regulon positive regulatory protein
MSRTSLSTRQSTVLAKLTPPRLPPIIERPRLYRSLAKTRERPIVWINAPPGFGKTTLVASYLRARKIRPLWYQLDEGDSDLATFFHYLGLTVQHGAPRQRSPLPHLTPEYLQGLPTFTRRFFENLYSRLKPPAVLVLDNYQEVPADSPFHEMLTVGVEAAPPGYKVIVMSRALPPPALARVLAAQQMSFIGEEALRLTKQESRNIVRLHARSKGPKANVRAEAMHDELQGWVAGLVLLLEQPGANRASGMMMLQKPPQVIFDYLAQEVMHRLTPERQTFLMQTAFLPEMTAAMARQLTGIDAAADILAHLYQSRYFTERRGVTDYVYQYHPLFRQFLRSHANAVLTTEEVQTIQIKAAALLEQAGRIEEAFELHQGAGAIEETVRLILTRGAELLHQGRLQTLEGWLKHVPLERYEQAPWLYYWLGTCRMPVAPLECEGHFERAFDKFKANGDQAGMLLAATGMVSSIFVSWLDVTRSDRWIDILLGLVPPHVAFPSKEIEIQVTFCLFYALIWRRPQRVVIAPWLTRAQSFLKTTPDIEKYSLLPSMMALLCSWKGDLASAQKYSTILQAVGESETTPPLIRLTYYANRAVLEWQHGDAQQALEVVEQGLALAKRAGVHVFDSALFGSGVYGSLLQGDLGRAERYLQHTAPLVTSPSHFMRANFLFQSAWVVRMRGDLTKAWELVQEGLEVTGLRGSPFPEADYCRAAAELLHGLGNDRRARHYLNRVRFIAEETDSFYLRYIGHLLESQFDFDQGREKAGLDALRKALVIGKDKGLGFYGWWIPETMARLYAKALEANIEMEYVQDLIRKTRLVPVGSASASEAWPWPVKIYTLGRFEVYLDGKPLPSRRKVPYRVLHLLKVIVALGTKSIAIPRLIDALWPDAEGDVGYETFHKTLQRLRRLLNYDQIIQVREGKVVLNRELCWVDVIAFEDLENHAALDDGELRGRTRIDHYQRMIALYRGLFLDEEECGSWVNHRRERLRQGFIEAVEKVSDWQKGTGRPEEALIVLEHALKVDPLAEPLYLRLIKLLQTVGRQDAAKTVLTQYRKTCPALVGRKLSVEIERLGKTLLS